MVLVGGAFGWWLSHDFMGIVPYERDLTEILSPFHHVRTQWDDEPGKGSSPECNHAGALILDSQPSGL